MTIQIEARGLGEAISRLGKPLQAITQKVILFKANQVVLGQLKEEAPKRRRTLANSIFSKARGADEYQYFEGADHGIFVRLGTRPHPIFPRQAKALWWPEIRGGRPVASVMHPGTRPNLYHIRAMNGAIRVLRGLVDDFGRQIAEYLSR